MIQDSVNRLSYDGNGIATEFAYPFSITTTNDVKVMIVSADGTETILTNDYYVDEANSKVDYPGYPPGEEPLPELQPPKLATGQRIVIYRELDVTQLTSLFDQYPFKTIEVMIDKVTILLQQLKDAQERALTLSVSTDTGVSLVLPAPSANKSFRWNATGTALELTADPATVLASVQGYTELAEGYATAANEKAGIATTGANTATEQANLAQGYAESINVETFNAVSADKLATPRKINGIPFDGSADINGALSFRNKIINGNFDIWQRGNTQTATGYGSADRWLNSYVGTTATLSKQLFTVGQTAIPNNPLYYARVVVNSVAGSNNRSILAQKIEDVTRLSGKTVTLSFYAKADSAKKIAVDFYQFFGTGGAPSANMEAIGVTQIALTSAWAKYTVMIKIPSISGKTLGTDNNSFLTLSFWLDAGSAFYYRTNSLGQQSGTFDIAQVQLEEGSVATEFEQRPLGLEMVLCQRYTRKYATNTVPLIDTNLRATPTISGSAGNYLYDAEL